MAGTFIGVIIGIISGIAALMLLKTLNRPSKKDTATIGILIGELLTLGAFMVGGRWASQGLFVIMKIDFNAPEYFKSLAIIFALIIIYPVFRLIIRLGEEFGRGAE